jgi:hypothetical protein
MSCVVVQLSSMVTGFLANPHDGHRFARAHATILMLCNAHGKTQRAERAWSASQLLDIMISACPSPRCANFVHACCGMALLLLPHLHLHLHLHLVPRHPPPATALSLQLVPSLLVAHLTSPSSSIPASSPESLSNTMLSDKLRTWLHEAASVACTPVDMVCVCCMCMGAGIDPFHVLASSPPGNWQRGVAGSVKLRVLLLASAHCIAHVAPHHDNGTSAPDHQLHSELASFLILYPTAQVSTRAWVHVSACTCCSDSIVSEMQRAPPRSFIEASSCLSAMERVKASHNLVLLISSWFIDNGASWLPLRTRAAGVVRHLMQACRDLAEHVHACIQTYDSRRQRELFPAPKVWSAPTPPVAHAHMAVAHPYSLGSVLRSPSSLWRANTRGALLAFLLLRKKQVNSALASISIHDIVVCLAFLRRQFAWVARAGMATKLAVMLQVRSHWMYYCKLIHYSIGLKFERMH